MKEVCEVSPDVEKSIDAAVDGDIEKVIQEEGTIEKSKMLGVDLSRIFGRLIKKGNRT